ncbi:MAG: M16 family metallopeptidase [Elusimicrobiota bacterium]
MNKKRPYKEIRFSNGVTIIYSFTEKNPISACHLFLPQGTGTEPLSKSGVTTLLWSLLLKGTKQRTAKEIAELMESRGASIGAGATHDYSEVSCHSISENFPLVLDLFSEVLFEPLFDKQEVEKERRALIAGIQSKKESIYSIASEELNKFLFENHAYSRPSSGIESTVKELSVEDLNDRHQSILSPHGVVLSIATNHTLKLLLPQLTKIFGSEKWKENKKEKKHGKIFETPIPPKSIEFEKSEHFEQAFLMMGFPAAPIASKDYVILKVFNGVLGGGMSTRLFQELREKHGLAYDVGSYYVSKKAGSSWVVYIGLQESRIEEAELKIKEVLNEISSKKIPAKELEEVKSYLKGSFILDHQTSSQIAHYLGWWKILGLRPNFDREYLKKINGVSSQKILTTVKKYLSLPSVTIRILPGKNK